MPPWTFQRAEVIPRRFSPTFILMSFGKQVEVRWNSRCLFTFPRSAGNIFSTRNPLGVMWRARATGVNLARLTFRQPPQVSISCEHLQGLCQKLNIRGQSFGQLFSTTRPPNPPAPASVTEAAVRGLRILNENADNLKQDDAMEALRCLRHAASAESGSSEVYLALGDLHYTWGHVLEFGKRAELGADEAAKAVISEIKELRRKSLKKRRMAPTSGGIRHGAEDRNVATAAAAGENKMSPSINHPEAWEWYVKAADMGDSRAMMQLGDIAFEAAEMSEVDVQHAEKWYRKAARGDPRQPDALFQLARIQHEGIGVPPDPDAARKLYLEACDAGSSAAAFFLGHTFRIGDDELGITKDGVCAMELLRQASERGHADAIFYLAQAHRSGAPELCIQKDVQRFSILVQEAAERGSEDAMFALGGAYFHGEDAFDRNPRAAFRYYSAAADLGHAGASYCLGVMHYTMGNYQDAFSCYQTAAESGNMIAWRNLASMYALGEGVQKSMQMAKYILKTFGDKIKQQQQEEGKVDKDPHSDAGI